MTYPGRMAAAVGLLLAACSEGESWRDESVQLMAPTSVDLSRYAGRWFEIGRFPNRFQENCAGAVHDYTPTDRGGMQMRITCRVATLAGPTYTYEGDARMIEDSNAVWKISLSPWVPWFFDGDYVILGVSSDYRMAVVGTQQGTTGWILSRDIILSDDDMRAAYDLLARNGYEMWHIILVDQPGVGN